MFNQRDPMDQEYAGNMFGWKISKISGLFLLGMLILIVGRHYYLGVPPGFGEPAAGAAQDSLELVDPKVSIDSLRQ